MPLLETRVIVSAILSFSSGSENHKEETMAFKMNHLHFKTPDPRKTAQWYIDFLGAKIVEERETPSGLPFLRLDLHGLSLNVTGFV